MIKERFFGLHFDFHANSGTSIGVRTNPADIEWFIREAQPDFIQCDCKGHPGLCSYPSKVGNPDPMLQQDNLKIWVDTVHRHGLPVYVHYSGIWEKAYTKAHPEAAARDQEGHVTEQASVFGPSCDDLLIPQMKELIDNYGIDGCWIDGECWAVNRDYSDMAKAHFHEGMTNAEHNRIMREGFLRYVEHYTTEIHKFAPNFRIVSNWLYTEQVPERPDIDVDFISGDFQPNDSAHAARYNARCIALQGKPWDLMAWSFGTAWDEGVQLAKSAQQLEQEAAVVLSQGGGFQVYITQNRDGSARKEAGHRFRELSEFVRMRHLNYGKKPLAQVGILYAVQSRYEETAEYASIFNPPHVCDALKGALQCILDAQYTLNVVLEHQIDTVGQYDILVVPEWRCMDDALKTKLLDYSRKGGHLVVMGAELCAQFGQLTGTEFGAVQKAALKSLQCSAGYFGNIRSDFIDLKSGAGTIFSNSDLRDGELPAWRTDALGSGSITYLPFNLGSVYCKMRSFYVTDYLKSILSTLAAPQVEIKQKNVDISMQENGDGILLNLINMNQNRHSQDYYVFDEVPVLHNLEIRLNKAYPSVAMPLGETFEFTVQDDVTVIRLKELHIHSIIELHAK